MYNITCQLVLDPAEVPELVLDPTEVPELVLDPAEVPEVVNHIGEDLLV
jgi:hypothetical protein